MCQASNACGACPHYPTVPLAPRSPGFGGGARSGLSELRSRAQALTTWKLALSKGVLPAAAEVDWPVEPFKSKFIVGRPGALAAGNRHWGSCRTAPGGATTRSKPARPLRCCCKRDPRGMGTSAEPAPSPPRRNANEGAQRSRPNTRAARACLTEGSPRPILPAPRVPRTRCPTWRWRASRGATRLCWRRS